jgi:predicted transposase/invertase (TIGR01784 family)
MLHYVSRLFSAGIEKGDKQYQNIKGVIGICITLFKMESPNFKTEYELIDNTDLSRKIDNFKIIFLQVPRISDTFEKCLSTTEQWIYIMRNINEIDSNIAQLRKEYEKLIDVSRMATLTEEERFNYFVAEHRLSCLIDSYETAKQDGRNDGLKEGREEGREEGLKQGLEQGLEQGERNKQIEIAKSLKQQNIDISIISNCTKLSPEEISRL